MIFQAFLFQALCRFSTAFFDPSSARVGSRSARLASLAPG
jgi:hypothetical protein